MFFSVPVPMRKVCVEFSLAPLLRCFVGPFLYFLKENRRQCLILFGRGPEPFSSVYESPVLRSIFLTLPVADHSCPAVGIGSFDANFHKQGFVKFPSKALGRAHDRKNIY